ncbi:redox-sensing transcriptional repressor Rex [Fervidobacterium pennivorans subsp. shakshaketiis]|jgi:redox-sensing transcriptional repressor|uniref:Redox-sensing transcriptional repressor Rex n=1 Tax=Fervidobacterium pennivorans (strain DSM 9078 / Ven5) TaxID=771875 RepID=H9UBS4_FERPD|nr:redox-sensing transcriptional repressor Rex [Fervidobacterium pennivorans]AFG34967.1 AT-rich DNA-binding protein [Fervidobacterium pennivorans DSM 9078]QIV78136.1 redox-sensing transcriptional repressor Rex [Fervidobacterium pennivorans subsp. keratinolyticus]
MKIPKPTVRRLGLYYRCLARYKEEGVNFVSSQDIADRLNIKPSQVRKDLSYFGEFGKRGLGYNVSKLISEIARIIGVNKEWNVAIIGAGNLGSALANYPGLAKHKFNVVAMFDNDRQKVGKKIAGIPVFHISELNQKVKELNIEMAVIAVPESAAQYVAELVEESGIKGIVNFSPIKLRTNIPVEDVDITLSFETLAYMILKNSPVNIQQEEQV